MFLLGSVGFAESLIQSDSMPVYGSKFSAEPKYEFSKSCLYGGRESPNYSSSVLGVMSAVAVNFGPLDVGFENYGTPYYCEHLKKDLSKFAKLGHDITSTVRFRQFSRSARNVDLDFQYQGEGISLKSGEDHFTVRVSARLKDCDNETVLTRPVVGGDIEEIISSFAEISFSDSLFCDFSVLNVATADIHEGLLNQIDKFREKIQVNDYQDGSDKR